MDEREQNEEIKRNLRLEEQLTSEGLVGKDMFDKFHGAWVYATASPMQWLVARLRLLERRLEDGAAVSLYDPEAGEVRPCLCVAELAAWVNRHFPETCVVPSPR